MMKRVIIAVIALGAGVVSWGQALDSRLGHGGEYSWKMAKASEVRATSRELSSAEFDDSKWMEAIVPGTVLTSLVENEVYPEPYYGTNNKISEKKIPDEEYPETDLVSLVDEDGTEYEFEVIDEIDYKDGHYYALAPQFDLPDQDIEAGSTYMIFEAV